MENQRQNLASIRQFEPFACFTRIDRFRKGVISANDIAAFLQENSTGGQQITSFESNYVIKYFDSSFQGHLNYQDFCQAILPCDNMSLRMHTLENRHQIRTKEFEKLLPEIESCLSRLLEMEIIYHLRLEQLKLDLEEIEDYDLKKLFKMVDKNRKKFIDKAAIKSFLKRMGHIVQPKEVVCILRRLDIDGDSRVSFHEFVEAISPISPETQTINFKQSRSKSPRKVTNPFQSEYQSSF